MLYPSSRAFRELIAYPSGYGLVIAANEARKEAARELRGLGATVEAVEADLASTDGVDKLYGVAQRLRRPVEALLANAGRGLGKAFLDHDFAEIMRVVNTNVTGTLSLIHKVGRDMRARGAGRILITGSIAGLMPGTYQAVYNGIKTFLDSFSFALRHELNGSGVTASCLMPGATETEFFERADMMDTKLGMAEKDDPAEVARQGFDTMMRGQGEIITGWQNKLQAAIAHLLPRDTLAEMNRRRAQPGTAAQ